MSYTNTMSLKIIEISLLFLISCVVNGQDDKTDEFLKSLQLIHSNDWNADVSCPPGFRVVGLKPHFGQIKPPDLNVTGVIGLKIICTDGVATKNEVTKYVNFGKSFGGTWGVMKKCQPGFGIGVSAIFNSNLGNRAQMSEFDLFCSGSVEFEKFGLTRNTGGVETATVYLDNGDRRVSYFCPENHAVSGISIQADSIITFITGDMTAVKEIMIRCRKIENPILTFQLQVYWERRRKIRCSHPEDQLQIFQTLNQTQQQQQSLKNISLKCNFEVTTGLKPNENVRNVLAIIKAYESSVSEIGVAPDLLVKQAIVTRLKSRAVTTWFENYFPKLWLNPLEDLLDSGAIWKQPQTYEQNSLTNLTKSPFPQNFFERFKMSNKSLKHTAVVNQLVADCGLYKVYFRKFDVIHGIYFEHKIKKRLTRIVFRI